MKLKYPKDLEDGITDYVIFTSHQYRTNTDVKGSDVSGNFKDRNSTSSTALPPSGGNTIVLFMPRSTPAMGNSNNWSEERSDTSAGALGDIKRDAAVGITNTIDKFGGSQTSVSDILAQLGNLPKVPAAIKQGLIEKIATELGFNPNSLLALARGKIYNPNVETIYQGPGVRGFSFTYEFAPKSYEEGMVVNKIIYEFKKWSSPSIAEDNSMYNIPMIWSVKYMTGKKQNPHMNAFKRSVLTNVSVQHNAPMDWHMSYGSVTGGDSGMPIMTTLALNFQEVDVIIREDHEFSESNTYQGY